MFLVLLSQILFPILFSSLSVAAVANLDQKQLANKRSAANVNQNLPELTSVTQTEQQGYDGAVARGLSQTGQLLTSDNRGDSAKNLAESMAYGFIGNQMSEWLNQFGNSRIQISSEQVYSGELLLPLFENERNLFFSQSRLQREDHDRTTLNLGLGYRNFIETWMWGVNSFYDRDLRNNNARFGIGFELAADYIKFSTNEYFRLTNWRQSKLTNFNDYDERPANGFDIRVEGFLPQYPSLGGNLKYEKYFGDNVNLKSSDSVSDLKDSPQAYTIGLSYTPVPLVSFKLNQSMGDLTQTQGIFELNYRIGVPVSQQLDPNFIADMRKLNGARYDFVDRNNTIVMQYKKQDILKISLPAGIAGVAYQTVTLTPTIVKNKYDISYVEWSAPLLLAKGGTLIPGLTSPYAATLVLPIYDNSSPAANTYNISAFAVDVKGNKSNLATTTLSVNKIDGNIARLGIDPNQIVADGNAVGTVTILVTDDNGNALNNVATTFTVQAKNSGRQRDSNPLSGIKMNGQNTTTLTLNSDANGKITFPISSTKSGDFALLAELENGVTQQVDFTFIANTQTARPVITTTADNARDDGADTNIVEVVVSDANDNLVPNQEVTMTIPNGVTVAKVNGAAYNSGDKFITNRNGQIVLEISSLNNQTFTISAEVNAQSVATDITFTASSIGTLTLSPNQVVANGSTAGTVTVTVVDNNGLPYPNILVDFKVTSSDGSPLGGIKLNGNTTTTLTLTSDQSGVVTFPMTSTKAGNFTLTASLSSLDSKAADIQFIADITTAQIAISTTANNAKPDGIEVNKVAMLVSDRNGNILANQEVSVTIPTEVTVTKVNGADYTAGDRFVSDSNGNITIEMVSNTAGTYSVTASINGNAASTNVIFTYAIDYSKSSIVLNKNRILANDGVESNGVATLTVTLVDTQGNPLTGLADDITLTPNKSGLTLSQLTETSRGVYTSNISSSSVDTYTIQVQLGNSFNRTTSQLAVYTYNFAMNNSNKKLGQKMEYQFYVVATASDNGNNVSTSGITTAWSSSLTNIATIDGSGLAIGQNDGNTVITAAQNGNQTLNGIAVPATITANLTVTPLIYSRVYGTSQSNPNSRSEFYIEPPDYVLSARGGYVVDQIGNTGGSGGNMVTIAHTDLVKSVDIVVCETYFGPNNMVIGQLVYNFTDGSKTSVGIARCVLQDGVTQSRRYSYTETIDIANQQLVGFVGWNNRQGNYVAGIQFITSAR